MSNSGADFGLLEPRSATVAGSIGIARVSVNRSVSGCSLRVGAKGRPEILFYLIFNNGLAGDKTSAITR
ncbi:hypothetical protein [Nevskia sp.]|uniref:hypothetical protein n=1 Tax=Nevskia sp. TaxID=1929292 RepID=UPI0025D55E7A|nr:hypothetical protein [Nevskia sp.]